MDIKEFAHFMNAKRRELDPLVRRELPKIVGRMAKDHFQDNFRKGGFVNRGLHPWKPARRLSSGGPGAAAKYGTLLSGDRHLFSSINYTPADYRVRVSNGLLYAPLHNWGGVTSPTVTDRMRRFAWAKFYEASGKGRKAASKKGRKSRQSASPTPVSENAQFWKNLALTKKTKLNIRIPQRQFLGENAELSDAIAARIDSEIRKKINW